jgi:hypothetical protein
MNRQRIFWLLLVAATIWSLLISWKASEFVKRDCSTEQDNARQDCEYTPLIAFVELVAFVRAIFRVSNEDRYYWCAHPAVLASDAVSTVAQI